MTEPANPLGIRSGFDPPPPQPAPQQGPPADVDAGRGCEPPESDDAVPTWADLAGRWAHQS